MIAARSKSIKNEDNCTCTIKISNRLPVCEETVKIAASTNRNAQAKVRTAGISNSTSALVTILLLFGATKSPCSENRTLSTAFAAVSHKLTAARIRIRLKSNSIALLEEPETSVISTEFENTVIKNEMDRDNTYTQHHW